MNLEIHKPELVQRVNAHIQTGLFHDADELLEQALNALDERAPAATPSASPASEASRPSVFEEGLGLFGSPEDAALLDEVVAMAYADRRRRSKSAPLDL
jgi:Arc/MetJ-type ribon-helix-helix transcriptional regulator